MTTFEEVEQRREAHEQTLARERQKIIAAHQQGQQRKQHAERLRDKLLDITYTELAATPAEIEWVNRLVKENLPERFGDPITHRMKLLTIRSLAEYGR